ncbi:MAG: bifunctional phosphoribosylaminoimidazolecarboxamide formyltransferase/IMP cyclohydrolase, partial [Planctomycetota bacterium]|nr:bifunctional phosphoribosylaminoimidazolecarboxamide formyltransferase/IMP cyclohydrolase [Planctomycetota bacterium]
AGLLARAGTDDEVLAEHSIGWIDLLVVNLYPFKAAVARADCTVEKAIENIDVGGPAMLRAAAKNHARVTVVVDPDDYERVLDAYQAGEPPDAMKTSLAVTAFGHTAQYDAAISRYLGQQTENGGSFPDHLLLGWRRVTALRYGENPHQTAAYYRNADASSGTIVNAQQLQGKSLSFNNIADADAALRCVKAFQETACVIVKHANPCGIAIASSPLEAYRAAYDTDPTSAFGGIVAFNRPLAGTTAAAIIDQQFVEVIIAPRIEPAARQTLAKKEKTRVLEVGDLSGAAGETQSRWDLRSLEGGLLLQDTDDGDLDDVQLEVVTKRQPSDAELADMRFAWTVVKYVKSNAIVYARDGRTLGIGAGQMSRVVSSRIAAMKASDEGHAISGAAMASDAFFPFRDGLDIAAEYGITAVIQPGGSMRDDEIIDAANEHGMTMILTGMRHFRH